MDNTNIDDTALSAMRIIHSRSPCIPHVRVPRPPPIDLNQTEPLRRHTCADLSRRFALREFAHSGSNRTPAPVLRRLLHRVSNIDNRRTVSFDFVEALGERLQAAHSRACLRVRAMRFNRTIVREGAQGREQDTGRLFRSLRRRAACRSCARKTPARPGRRSPRQKPELASRRTGDCRRLWHA